MGEAYQALLQGLHGRSSQFGDRVRFVLILLISSLDKPQSNLGEIQLADEGVANCN
jgi:hypothetical protein